MSSASDLFGLRTPKPDGRDIADFVEKKASRRGASGKGAGKRSRGDASSGSEAFSFEFDGTDAGVQAGTAGAGDSGGAAGDAASASDDSIRPARLEDFIGQDELRANLRVYLNAARDRGQAMDHTLFHGNPGLGKTTLAQIMAAELGVNLVTTTGPVLERTGDLAAILTNLGRHDILFVDEIHRMPIAVEEILYSAMEDFKLDLVIGQGPAARTVKIDLEPFTLVGATTRIDLISSPLRDRFGIVSRLEFYTPDDLARVVMRTARIMGVAITEDGAREIGRRSRGTPRIANRLLRRARDFAAVYGEGVVDGAQAANALARMDVDELGLDSMDRKILKTIIDFYDGGPVGLNTLAAACAEGIRAIEDIHEPYLIQCGFLKRTPRGRMVTARAYSHLGLPLPRMWQAESRQGTLC